MTAPQRCAHELTDPTILQKAFRRCAVKFQPDVAIQSPAVLAPEDVQVHLGCVDAQFSAGSEFPVGHDTPHLVVGQIVSLPE
jgi:hypothetical protein